MRPRGALVAVLLGGALAAPADAATSSPYDLRPVRVASPPATATPGAAFTVAWAVRRTGRSATGARLRFLLSRDARRSRDDRVLATTGTLALTGRRRSAAGTQRLRVPAATPAGGFRLLACVVQRRPDRKTGNDCRAAAGRLRVTAGAPGGLTPPVGGPTASAPPPPAAVAPPPSGAPETPPPAGGPGGSGTTGPPPIEGTPFPRPESPLDVAPVVDADGEPATTLVTPAGARLEAEADDGTAFVLHFPPDAVWGPVQVTMTPLASVGGLPGALVGAVRLEPEGLVLNRPATLTVEPAGATPAPERRVAFTGEGDGRDAHALRVGDPDLTTELLHFSIIGLTAVESAEARALLDRVPRRTQAQLEQLVAEELQRDGRPSTAAFLGFFRDVVRPALVAGLDTDAALERGIQRGFGWLRQLELTGVGGDPVFAPHQAEVLDLIVRGVERAADRAFARCVEHDLSAIGRLLQVQRSLELLGATSDRVAELGRRCLTFEADLEGELLRHGPAGGTTTLRLRATDARFGPLLDHDTQGGPLTYVQAGGAASRTVECPSTEGTRTETTEVVGHTDGFLRPSLAFDTAPRLEGAPEPPPGSSATLVLDVGDPRERYRTTSTGACPLSSSEVTNGLWESLWGLGAPGVAKVGEGLDHATVFADLPRAPGNGALLFRVVSQAAFQEYEEASAVEVWHRPAG